MKQVIAITGSVPSECLSIRRMTEVKCHRVLDRVRAGVTTGCPQGSPLCEWSATREMAALASLVSERRTRLHFRISDGQPLRVPRIFPLVGL